MKGIIKQAEKFVENLKKLLTNFKVSGIIDFAADVESGTEP